MSLLESDCKLLFKVVAVYLAFFVLSADGLAPVPGKFFFVRIESESGIAYCILVCL